MKVYTVTFFLRAGGGRGHLIFPSCKKEQNTVNAKTQHWSTLGLIPFPDAKIYVLKYKINVHFVLQDVTDCLFVVLCLSFQACV